MKKIPFLLVLIISTNLFGQIAPSNESIYFHYYSKPKILYSSDGTIILLDEIKITEKQISELCIILESGYELFEYSIKNNIDITIPKEIGIIENIHDVRDRTIDAVSFSITVDMKKMTYDILMYGKNNYTIKKIHSCHTYLIGDLFENQFMYIGDLLMSERESYINRFKIYSNLINNADEKINAFLNK